MQANPYTGVLTGQTFSLDLLSVLHGLLGIAALLGLTWLLSTNRRQVDWGGVAKGLLIQILIASMIIGGSATRLLSGIICLLLLLLIWFTKKYAQTYTWKTALLWALIMAAVCFVPMSAVIAFVSKCFIAVLAWTEAGSTFLFGDLVDRSKFGSIFAFQVMPAIIFFSALTSLFFYLGILQKTVWALAWIMSKALHLSGAESLATTGNIFVGQTVAPLLIKLYLPQMSKSELVLVMTAGMATMAVGVLAVYINMLGAEDTALTMQFAKHLLSASIMAAPGAVVLSKILVPQTGPVNTSVAVPKDKIGKNVLDAISNGTAEGLKLAVNIAAMLLVSYALIAGFNFIVEKTGAWTHINDLIIQWTNGRYTTLSLEFILAYIFAPLIWLIGTPAADVPLLGELLGQKLILTEFIGYQELAAMMQKGTFTNPKSIIMATYVLCGFANFASVGVQISGIGSLAPSQRQVLTTFGMRALLGGSLTAMLSAAIAGMIIG